MRVRFVRSRILGFVNFIGENERSELSRVGGGPSGNYWEISGV
jgi:hypothetical protein